jgi:GntR family transcriptional repressor for pyruvate dehydrogenase complex
VKSRTKVALEEGTPSTYRPQYEIAAEKIVEFISTTALKPGDRLPTEQKLGEQMGMSRGIVREAIKSLAASGLVTVRKGAGLYVAGDPRLPTRPVIHPSMTVDPEHVQAFFDFRCMQEMLTARLATEQMTLASLRDLEKILTDNRRHAEAEDWNLFLESDDSFHATIAQATHNPFLIETVANILHVQRWMLRIITDGTPGSLLNLSEQHDAIFQAMKSGDAEEAAQLMKKHIETVLAFYRQEVRRRLMS